MKKDKLTYKDVVKKNFPQAIDEDSAGGALGCPFEWFEDLYETFFDENCCQRTCEECWNRCYNGEKIIENYITPEEDCSSHV